MFYWSNFYYALSSDTTEHCNNIYFIVNITFFDIRIKFKHFVCFNFVFNISKMTIVFGKIPKKNFNLKIDL